MRRLSFENDENKQSKSLLVQALAVPNLSIPVNDSSSHHLSPLKNRPVSPDPFIPLHSDFTIPTSNVGPSPPPEDLFKGEASDTSSRRNILGYRVEQKYARYHKSSPACKSTSEGEASSSSSSKKPPLQQQQHHDETETTILGDRVRELSDLTPPSSPLPNIDHNNNIISPLPHPHLPKQSKWKSAHETIHAQSLLLGLAFLCVWSPQNCMAPNLTEMADTFDFNDAERDFYLGANVALATGVLSLPISAGIGILADLYNRKHLFVITIMGGALASFATGISRNYRCLFVARLVNGGCMSGSTPVAFSLLGDLFHTDERNAASSGLTAMMGIGIIAGQVYAGMVGSTLGWSHAFYVSSIITLVSAVLVMWLVQEPVRGGKEEVLQDMLRHGTRYERTLSWKGFCHAMSNNESNRILMWQGFFSSVPWGIIFVFLNDYLSQERGFSVPDATFLVFMFGLGCAAGGVLGGYWGQLIQSWNRAWLPLFMAATTFVGIFPFVGLLNSTFVDAHGVLAIFYSVAGGCIASLPSVNVRPCLINVNPPETRGAALTAANLIINLARGAGPSCITLLGAIWGVNRRFSFNVTLAFFWTVSALQLVFLSRTLPKDQDAMETELARYAADQMELANVITEDDSSTIVSIEDRRTSFDERAARETVKFMGTAFREIGDEFRHFRRCSSTIDEGSEEDDAMDIEDIEKRREIWKQQQQRHQHGMNGANLNGGNHEYPSEQTSLLSDTRRLD